MKKPPFKMIVETEMERYRYDTFWDKEVETLCWIARFEDACTFFDIGANIGIYSLYAVSIHPNILVYAFEPILNNFMRLNENIKLNGFEKQIIPIYAGVGLSDVIPSRSIKFNWILAEKSEIGTSGAQLETLGKVENPIIKNKIMTFSIDDFIAITRIGPDYIKIDVDGGELGIINGMYDILKGTLKGCLVEINEYREAIRCKFVQHGFTYENEPLNYLSNHSRYRRAKEGIKCENVIFTRR